MEKSQKKRGKRKNKFTAESIAVISGQIQAAAGRVEALNTKLQSEGFDGELIVDAGRTLVTAIEVIEDWAGKIDRAIDLYRRRSDRASAGVPEPVRTDIDP